MLGRKNAGVGCSQSKPLPNGMVRRKSNYADFDHPRHTHKQDPFPAKPGILAATGNVVCHHANRDSNSIYSSWLVPRLYRVAETLLATAGGVPVMLRFADTGSENLAAT